MKGLAMLEHEEWRHLWGWGWENEEGKLRKMKALAWGHSSSRDGGGARWQQWQTNVDVVQGWGGGEKEWQVQLWHILRSLWAMLWTSPRGSWKHRCGVREGPQLNMWAWKLTESEGMRLNKFMTKWTSSCSNHGVCIPCCHCIHFLRHHPDSNYSTFTCKYSLHFLQIQLSFLTFSFSCYSSVFLNVSSRMQAVTAEMYCALSILPRIK